MTPPQGEMPPGLIARLRARGVFRVAASYAVIAWLLLQIADVTLEPIGAPPWAMRALISTVVAGFPVALLLAWLYELTPRGLERDRWRGDAIRPTLPGLRRYADLIVIAVLALAVVVLLLRQSDWLEDPLAVESTSLAILPFDNVTDRDADAYLAAGLGDELRDQLSRIDALTVIARSSSHAIDGQGLAAPEIADRLGVAALVEGTLRRDGTRLRITVQLVDGRDGRVRWSGDYDRDDADLLAVQREIAQKVVDALLPSFGAGGGRLPEAATTLVSAQDLYLLARSYERKRDSESLARAETLYRDAIAQDPGYAAAHSGLGRTLSFANAALAGDDPEQLDRIVLPHLARALELDPGLAEPYMVMGNLRRWSLRAGGDDFYRLASQLEPSNAMAHENLAALAHSQNRPDQMLEHALRARELDPLAFGTHQKVISALVVLGRLQELDAAVARMNATLAGNPTAITLTCNVHLLSGDPPRAIACADEALRELGEEPGLIGILAESHARLGLVDEEQRFSDRLADEGDPRAALWGLVDRDDRTALRDTLDAALAGPVAFHEGIELARAAAAGGFPERALQIYEVAGVLEATRNDAVVRASGMESLPEIVLLLRQAGRAAEAQPLVERLLEWSARPLEHGARHADTIAFHGVALAVAGRLDQAFARLNQAVDAFGSPFDARVLTEGPVGALLGADPRLEHVFAALQNRQAALRAALPMPPR